MVAGNSLAALIQRIWPGKRGAERRAFPREEVGAPVGVAHMGGRPAKSCTVHDISATGALLVPRLDLKPGESLSLTLENPAMNLPAQVVEDSDRGTAVTFDSSEQGAALAGWLKATASMNLNPLGRS